MNYAVIDLASLAWLLPELDSTLKLARTHLANAQQGGAADLSKHLTAAKRAVHDAAGALQVIEAKGVVRYLETLEKTIEHCAALGALDTHAHAVMDEACYAVNAYLNELHTTGVALQPVVLFADYEALCLLNPAHPALHNCHPADLYFPDLSPRLAAQAEGNQADMETHPMNLQKMRSTYESLLLKVFKHNANTKDLNNLSMLLGIIANDAAQAHAYSFWKTCQAVANTLHSPNSQQALGLKRWLGRLNLQIQRLSSGSKHLSERLFREALFYLASIHPSDQDSDQLHRAIVATYKLAGSVPPDLKHRRFGHALPVNTAGLLDKLTTFKLAWDEAAPPPTEAEGIALSQGMLLRRLRIAQQLAIDLQSSFAEHTLPVLLGVAQALAQAATALSDAAKPLHKSLGLEGAKAILWLEETIKHPGQSQNSQREQAQAIIARLGESVVSDMPLPIGAQMSAHSTHQLMGQVVREAVVTLSTVEKQLDDYFRFGQDTAILQATRAPLSQTSSTLDLLGLPQVSLAIGAIESRIAGFIAQPSSASQAAFSSLAVLFSQVTSLLDLFTRAPARAQTDFAFDAASGELKSLRLASAELQEQPFDSVESLSQQRRANAQALIKELVAKPQDAAARTALVESIQALKDDAALTGDTALTALGSVDLGMVTLAPFDASPKAQMPSVSAAALHSQPQDLTHDLPQIVAHEQAKLEPQDQAQSQSQAKSLAQLDALLSTTVASSPATVPMAHSEDDLYGIFLEEARGVLSDAEHLLQDLEATPNNLAILTDVRRSFHTLKGSARMVGFKAFGDAAWHVEQVVNTALARHSPASMDLIQFMRCGREGLSAWLLQLDDALLTLGVDPSNEDGPMKDNAALDFAVDSTLAGFSTQLAPYLQAIERQQGRQTLAPTISASEAVPLDTAEPAAPVKAAPPVDIVLTPDEAPSIGLTPSPATRGPISLTELNVEPLPSKPLPAAPAGATVPTIAPAVAASVATATVEPPRPKISLVANNEGLREQDFIDKARSAVLQAQAIEQSQPEKPAPSLILNPVQIAPLAADLPEPAPQDTMVSIGPLRLPKPLYAIYLQEASQHIDGLQADLSNWQTQAPRPSSYDAYKHAHSLKGSAATIGFGAMKALAAPLEAVLQLSVESELAFLSGDLTVLEAALQAIQQTFQQFEQGRYPEIKPLEIDALAALSIQLTLRSKQPAQTASEQPSKPASDYDAAHQALLAKAESAAQREDELAIAALDTKVALAASHQSAQQAHSAQALPSLDQLDVFDDIDRFSPQALATTVQDDAIVDEIDADIWQDFVQESDMIMPRAQSCLVALPNDSAAINDLRRDLHTLKGSARMAGAMRMGALLHAMESKLEKTLQAQSPYLTPSAHEALLDDYDDINALYEALKNPQTNPQPTPALSKQEPVLETPHQAPYLNMMAQASALFDEALSVPAASASAAPQTDEPPELNNETTTAHKQTAPAALPAIPKLAQLITPPTAAVTTMPPSPAPLALRTPVSAKPAAAPSSETALALPALRMRTDVLDNLVNQASEVSSSKGRMDQHVIQLRGSLRELTDNVERLRNQLREIEIQAESQMATRTELSVASNTQFDPLEFDRFTRFQELTRMLTESLNDMLAVRDSVTKTLLDTERELGIQSKASKDLTQSLMRSRLVAFDAVSDRLYRVVRQAARELGKQVALDIQGGHLTLDRSILERITGGLEHLVRNSVVHGIELPATRLANKKTAQGTITIKVTQQGNELEIVLSDDGAGLPLDRIRDLALAKGMLSKQTLPTVQQLAEFIFTPGFSTADSVTELAGRGIGMDVVRSDIVSLGGRITLSTTPQHNTRFSIRIPLTLAINQVLMVVAQGVQYAIPTSLIQSVVSVKASDLALAYNQKHITQRALNYPFAHLAELLNVPLAHTLQSGSASVILLSNGSDTAAIHVDSVLGSQEAVVKPLSTVLLRIPGLSSATLLNDGKLCLILDPVQLSVAHLNNPLSTPSSPQEAAIPAVSSVDDQSKPSAYSASPQQPSPSTAPAEMVQVVSTRSPSPAAEPKPIVPLRQLAMVIDDSLTVRKVTQKLLLREGWEVLLAKDGIDALEQLQTARPSVLLVDIEMPRMDGFDLTRNVRASEALKAIPIIMITSRIADKHRDHAFSLGVNAYMGKPYRDDELLAKMQELTATQAG